MKKGYLLPYITLCFALIWLSTLRGQDFPQYRGYVNDFANVIPADFETRIEALANELKSKTGAEIAVVTIDNVDGYVPEEYVNRLFSHWGIGEKGKDNGVLILDVIQARRVGIEVGYGLEGILPDGLTGEIQDRYMIPYLRNDDYGNGLYQGMRALATVIAEDQGVTLTGQAAEPLTPSEVRSDPSPGSWLRCCPIIILFIIIMIVTRGRALPWLLLGVMSSGGRGGFSSGGFSGGFGGFGGGMSGGGGSFRSY
ncbi:TPM domain-containing protein [bacterium]|nr:TPM domain-containing protein [bacterium]